MFPSHFSPFKTYIDPESRTALILNPKVLTIFTRALLTDGLREFRGLSDPSEGRYGFWKNARSFPVARLRDYLDFLRRPERYEIHAFVRNPYARALSGWKDKFRDGHLATPDGAVSGYPRSMRGRELRQARAFAAARGLPGAAPGTLFPFATFVQMLADQPAGQRNHHWDQQVCVLGLNRLPALQAWRIEDQIETGMTRLCNRLGFDPAWGVARLGVRVNASGATTEPFYDAGIADRLYAANVPDFDRFGYARDSWQGL